MKVREGTRQKSRRNLGICLSSANFAMESFCDARANSPAPFGQTPHSAIKIISSTKIILPFDCKIGGGRSEGFSGDCLSKTQVPAKLARGNIGAET